MRFRKCYLLFLLIMTGVNAYGDVAFGDCRFVNEKTCVRSSGSGDLYFSVESGNYRGHEIVWLLKLEPEGNGYKQKSALEGESPFYVFPKGYSPMDVGSIRDQDAIYAKLENSSVEESIEQFFKLYEIVSRSKGSKKNFDSAFSGLNFWERFLYGYGEFRKSYLESRNGAVELRSIVYASTPECGDCLHFVFANESSRWLLSGTMTDSSIHISDLAKLD